MTERLVLRPPEMGDAARIRELAGAREIADTTLVIPHPYPEGAAEAFIGQAREWAVSGAEHVFAITLASSRLLVGCASLRFEITHARAEIGYWVGVPHWRKGYATEAARRLVGHAFETLGLNRVYASCFSRNPASCRVLEKSGLVREGLLREHVRRFGRFEDLVVYGAVRGRPSG